MTFAELSELLEKNPDAYRAEVARLQREDPAYFAAFVRHLRDMLASANASEDRITARREGRKPPPARDYVRRYSSIAGLVVGHPKQRDSVTRTRAPADPRREPDDKEAPIRRSRTRPTDD